MPLHDPMLQDILDVWTKAKNERRLLEKSSTIHTKKPSWISSSSTNAAKNDKVLDLENSNTRIDVDSGIASFLESVTVDDLMKELARRGSSERRRKSSVLWSEAKEKMLFGIKERASSSRSKGIGLEEQTSVKEHDSELVSDLLEKQEFCTSELCIRESSDKVS